MTHGLFLNAAIIVLMAAMYNKAESTPQDIYRAAAPSSLGCDCQCHHYVWLDRYRRVQGNCRSSYRGSRWCYVDNYVNNNCDDLQFSRNKYTGFGQRRIWSYQACATPALSSPECDGKPGGIAPRQG